MSQSAIDWRTATSDEILANLAALDLEGFEHALQNAAFTEDHVRLLLREPGLPPELLERISREPRLFKRNAIRVALAMHAKLPRVRGLELVRYLYWRDLIRVAAQARVHPQVRAVAEQVLAERIPDLTLGERIAVARAAGRAVLRALRTDPSPRVTEALLRNFRCTEEDVLFIVSSAETPPAVLAVVAKNTKWRCRAPVRAQLVKNRRLALPLALGLLSGLGQDELAAVMRQSDLPRLLRQAAERLRTSPKPIRGARPRSREDG